MNRACVMQIVRDSLNNLNSFEENDSKLDYRV